ncbi:MAG: hypothetical protein KKF56_03955 [Nanoarchaeota archaeon]|nr:hypothetical protein [Nanoarchaeota archaeon]
MVSLKGETSVMRMIIYIVLGLLILFGVYVFLYAQGIVKWGINLPGFSQMRDDGEIPYYPIGGKSQLAMLNDLEEAIRNGDAHDTLSILRAYSSRFGVPTIDPSLKQNFIDLIIDELEASHADHMDHAKELIDFYRRIFGVFDPKITGRGGARDNVVGEVKKYLDSGDYTNVRYWIQFYKDFFDNGDSEIKSKLKPIFEEAIRNKINHIKTTNLFHSGSMSELDSLIGFYREIIGEEPEGLAEKFFELFELMIEQINNPSISGSFWRNDYGYAKNYFAFLEKYRDLLYPTGKMDSLNDRRFFKISVGPDNVEDKGGVWFVRGQMTFHIKHVFQKAKVRILRYGNLIKKYEEKNDPEKWWNMGEQHFGVKIERLPKMQYTFEISLCDGNNCVVKGNYLVDIVT